MYISNPFWSIGGPVPDAVYSDAAPLNVDDIPPITSNPRSVQEGTNMIVTLVTGDVLVGRVERFDANHITVGTSEMFLDVLIQTAREV